MLTKKFDSVEDYNAAYDELYNKAFIVFGGAIEPEKAHEFILSVIGDRPKYTPPYVSNDYGDITVTCLRTPAASQGRLVRLGLGGNGRTREYFAGSNGTAEELLQLGKGLVEASKFLDGVYE